MARTTAHIRNSFATVNPYTNEVVREFLSLRGEEVDREVERAHRASQPWRERTAAERAGVVGRAAVLMPDPRVLRRDRPGADRRSASGEGRRGLGGHPQRPARGAADGAALELPRLPGDPYQRPESGAWQHD